MKIVEKTAGRLVLQEKPWLVVFVGGLFVIAGIVMAIRTGEIMAGSFALLGAFLILAFGNIVTATFNASVDRFTRTTKGLVRNSEVTHPLHEIAGVAVEKSRSGKPSRSYRVALTLASGARVPLTTSYSSGKDAKEQTASAIRQFLNLAPEPEIRIPGFSDLFKLMFDPAQADRIGQMLDGSLASLPGARPQMTAARDAARGRGDHALADQIDAALQKMAEDEGRRRLDGMP